MLQTVGHQFRYHEAKRNCKIEVDPDRFDLCLQVDLGPAQPVPCRCLR